MPLGAKVTLRKTAHGDEFLDRLVTVALPRVRHLPCASSKSFDGRGNFALGIKEQTNFPEINYDKVDQVWGMDVVVCTTAKTDEEARALLGAIEFPVPAVTGTKTRLRAMAKKSAIEKNKQAHAAGEAVRRQAREAEGGRGRPEPRRPRSASRRA